MKCTVCDMCHSHIISIGQSVWFGTNSCGIQRVSGCASIKLGNFAVMNSTHNNSRFVMCLLMSLSLFIGSTQFYWFCQHRFTKLDLQDLYACRTAWALSEKFPVISIEHCDECISAPRWKYIACNIAQLLCLVVLWFLWSLRLLLPYYVFYKITRHNLGLDIAAAYGTFIVILLMLVAFIGKWVLLGRVTEGDLPKEITVYYGDGFIYCWTPRRLRSDFYPSGYAPFGNIASPSWCENWPECHL